MAIDAAGPDMIDRRSHASRSSQGIRQSLWLQQWHWCLCMGMREWPGSLGRSCWRAGLVFMHAWASSVCIHHGQARLCARRVSQGDTELTFYSVIAWQLNPMAYCAYMGAGLFLSKPRQAACDGLGSIRARCVYSANGHFAQVIAG